MAKKSYKKLNKFSSFSKTPMKKNNIYLNNISMNDAFEIINTNESEEISGLILKNMLIAGVTMFTMAQISISALPEKTEYVDSLPSYKDIKKKFVTGETGRTLAACIGIATSYPWLLQDPDMQGEDCPRKVSQIIIDLVENPSPNIRRIKPSISDWQQYAKGEMGASLGQILSCPTTNLKVINIDGSSVRNYNLEEAIYACGINKGTLEKFDINKNSIFEDIRSIYLVNSNGIPLTELEYDEPKAIYSKIQEEILGNNLRRTGTVNINLKRDFEPKSAISKIQIDKYLNKYELIAYNFAIRSGDKNILKKYIDVVKSRANLAEN